MSIQPDRLGFTFAINQTGTSVDHFYYPSQGPNSIELYRFASQGVPTGPHRKPANTLYVYTDNETDKVIQRSGEAIIGLLRTETNDAKKSLAENLTHEFLQKISKVFEEKSSSSDQRSIAQRFEALDHDIRQVKEEVVKQINGVLIEEVKKESQSEIATLRAELEASKAQVKTLEEQLKSLAAEVTKIKELSTPK